MSIFEALPHQEPPILSSFNSTVVQASITLRETKVRIDERNGTAPLVEMWARKFFAGIPADSSEYEGGALVCAPPDCQILGPTIRIQPGQTLKLTVYNDLPSTANNTKLRVTSREQLFNTYANTQITNLHTHGLHISAKGAADDVFAKILPGSSRTYVYDIPANHMGGTFFYHTHKHQAETLQTGLGAAGAIIIEDMPNALPPQIMEMPELLFGVLTLPIPFLSSIAAQAAMNCQCVTGNCNACDSSLLGICIKSCSAHQYRDYGPGREAIINWNTSSTTCPLNSAWCTGWEYDEKAGHEVNEEEPICFNNPLLRECQGGVGSGNGLLQDGGVLNASASWTAVNASQELVLINGLLQPNVTVEADVWYRLRIIFAAISSNLQFGFCGESNSGDPSSSSFDPTCLARTTPFERHGKTTCSMLLLAKDGIYLIDAPRLIGDGWLGPGNRADLLVKCPPGVHSFNTYAEQFRVPESEQDTFRQNLAIFHARRGSSLAPNATRAGCVLEKFSVTRPCYLTSLTTEALSTTTTLSEESLFNTPETNFTITFGTHPFIIIDPYGDELVFESKYVKDVEMPGGQAIQIHLEGMLVHPIHIHINPYQLQMSPKNGTNTLANDNDILTPERREAANDGRFNGYFETGDWHDTLLLPSQNSMTVRFQTDTFGNESLPFHCHILGHSDIGMWRQLGISEEPIMEWPGAKQIEPQCYTSSEIESGIPIPAATLKGVINGTGTRLCYPSSSPPSSSEEEGGGG